MILRYFGFLAALARERRFARGGVAWKATQLTLSAAITQMEESPGNGSPLPQ
jgi:hypothetical protein